MVGTSGIWNFSFPGAFKTHGQGDFHPIINEWGVAWAVPGPGEGGP
jgi:hypothetical protein